MKTSQMDYVLAHLKSGTEFDVAAGLNRLWLACGLTSVVIEGRRFLLRKTEDV